LECFGVPSENLGLEPKNTILKDATSNKECLLLQAFFVVILY